MPEFHAPTKSDWKLFQARLPIWQENYMARLCDEYAAILTGPKHGADAFWEIEKRIRKDKKRPGVKLEIFKEDMPFIILELLRDGALKLDDLREFSDGFQEYLDFLMERNATW